MKKTSNQVVFFGSGPVAAKSLELLLDHTAIEAVITRPRPAHHRGETPVLTVAQKHSLTIHTPANKAELTRLFTEVSFQSLAGLVIDYGIIIAKDVIEAFPFGIVNSHFSLLPQWRGADPISFAILSGQTETGVSLMQIDEKMDEGPLIAQTNYPMPSSITAPQLTNVLIELSDAMIQAILPEYLAGKIDPMPQQVATIAPSNIPSYSRMLTKKDGIIDWQKPAEELEREIRAFIEWPKSRTILAEKDVVIMASEVVDLSGEPGNALVRNKSELIIYCGKKALNILRLKPAGKKEMSAEAFLAGHNVS